MGYLIYSVLIVLILSLQGCMDVASTGAQAVYNRHSLTKTFNDQYVTMRAYRALHLKTDAFKDTNIAISTYHGEVLLAGQVPEAWQKKQAEKLIQGIPNIERVYNLLRVENPSSSLVRVSDSWITAKVKAKLMASDDLDGAEIKVVTENGTVYLMGIVKPEEAPVVVDLASNTDGVLSVVKIFSYMQISKKLPA